MDSSAIVKYYVTEPGSLWVRNSVDTPQNSSIICEISMPEVAAALSQMRESKRFGQKFMQEAFAHFQNDLRRGLFLIRPVDADVIERAAMFALDYGIKGYDAVQVASALIAQERTGLQIIFVSGDGKALRVAIANSMLVDNPFDHVAPEDMEYKRS
ncbi:MAG: type II toxin-antitoxin system VapC family toxin [Caldilineaceae bacterium]